MPPNRDNSFFARLISPLLGQIQRIAYGTRGEQSVDDLKTEAWLAAQDIREEHGVEYEPEDEIFQQAILSKLRKAFGKFANREMRFAVQLDHEQTHEDGDFIPNSIAARLTAPDAYEPEQAMELVQEWGARESYLAGRFAEAVAYFRSLDHFDGDRDTLATHLAITVGMLDSRLRRAEIVAECQPSMFDGIEAIPRDFVPHRGRSPQFAAHRPSRWATICARWKIYQLRLFSNLPALLGKH
ncbi:hypothetical protein [Paraburkholderia aromaticivorans]|uniref:hypothetical protein n=1 Tax=Paraburkholderia aromaticivorans TaxID=2026199 RepID=UPI0012FE1583|nr:hypothetical protein [Paraburkholderia aromaticivorans]